MPLRIPALILLCFAADLALGVAFVVDSYLGEPTQLFHLEMEANLPTWYASAQLLLVALLLGHYAASRFDRRRADAWLLVALPLLFLALSADETAGIHEWIGRRTDALLPDGTRDETAFARTGIWMFVLGLPLVAFFLFAFHRLRPHLAAPGVLPKLVLGMVVFVTGAVGIETLGNFVEVGSAAYVLQVFAEEVLEMLGVTLFVWAAYDLLVAAGLYPVGRPAPARRSSPPPPARPAAPERTYAASEAVKSA